MATGLGVGLAPVAPGTFGSALAGVLFVLLLGVPPLAYALILAGVVVVGVWASEITQAATGKPDDGRIVIDEIAGQLVTLAPLLLLREPDRVVLGGWIVTGFVLFRVLDIWKPGPVGWAERRLSGGAGVMADDVVAGILGAGILLLALAATGRLGWVADPVGVLPLRTGEFVG